MIKTNPLEIWAEYRDGVDYNHSINLYDENVRNENFFNGKQWEGLNAPDLDKPVFNIMKRIANMQLAYIVSDDIGVSLKPFIDDGSADEDMKILSREVEKTIEYAQIKKKNRRVLRDGFVQGDGCMHLYFDDSIKTGTASVGVIGAESLDITNYFFGNPADNEVQSQPYIIVLMRRYIDDARAEAVLRGEMTPEEAEINIVPDNNTDIYNDDITKNDLVSVLVKYWKQDGSVWCTVTTENVVIRKPWDTGLELYPIAFMNWEEVKNRYHGQSAVAQLIPNQIFINKGFAMHMDYFKKLAFPKLIYDSNRFPRGFSNRIGEAIAVNGNVAEAITSAFKMPDLDAAFLTFIEKTYQYTQETLGASDAALGNIRPDNATAIVATQQATTAPLELVRGNFHQFVEDTVRIILDLMRTHYGTRDVIVEKKETDENGAEQTMRIKEAYDFSKIGDYALNLEINVGSSSYWSEIMQMQTAGNFLATGVITDPEIYLEAIPDKYVSNKQKLIENIREQKKAAQTSMPEQTPAQADVLGAMQNGATVPQMPQMM